MNTDRIHDKFKQHFGTEYKRANLSGNCKFILRKLGLTTKNPVEEVKRNWSKVCQFLIDWNGEINKTVIIKTEKKKVPVMELTEEQKQIVEGKICPYCKQPSQYVDSSIIWGKSYGMLYYCKGCAAWVGTHKGEPTKALGRLANAELRELKKAAHDVFDPIYKSNLKSRHEAYTWLSEQLNIPREYTHIGFFGVETCKKVIEICKLELQ